MSCARPILVALALAATAQAAPAGRPLDLAPFARRCCVADRNTSPLAFESDVPAGGPDAERAEGGRFVYGLQWEDERDLEELRVRTAAPAVARQALVEYWFRTWPHRPARAPSVEDPLDDPWQGRWVRAETTAQCTGNTCRFRFRPLAPAENPRAEHLPGVLYRRTSKARLVFPAPPRLARVEAFTGTRERVVELWSSRPGRPTVTSGRLLAARPDGAGLRLRVAAAVPSLPGSNDVTVVTLEDGARTFSFAVPDVERGPVVVPSAEACVRLARDRRPCTPAALPPGGRIRALVPREPEQSLARARREIPPLDPVERQWGGPLYLPLAADGSWQKFAFAWGGHVFVSKDAVRARADDRARLEWEGDRLDWLLGVGDPPHLRAGAADARLSLLEGHLPIARATFAHEGIEFEEEAFATLLHGPLGPEAGRDERTPAVLAIRLRARARAAGATARVSLLLRPAEPLALRGGLLLARDGALVRARLALPAGAAAAPVDGGVTVTLPLGARGEASLDLFLPFLPRLGEEDRRRLTALAYDRERERVLAHWRPIAARALPFEVPEPALMSFARGVVPRIRASTFVEPKSGLLLAPAATYVYDVCANESAFQALALDVLGHAPLATRILDGLLALQGSKPVPGTFAGDQSAVLHGARVAPDRDHTMTNYGLDHGTVLLAVAEHYLYMRDRAWLGRHHARALRAADWIAAQRRLTTRPLPDGAPRPEHGLLPGGSLEDNDDWAHWFAVNAYAAAALVRLAEALADAGLPDAERLAAEGAAFRSDLRAAVLRASRRAPVVQLRDGTYVPYVPVTPYQRFRRFGPLRAGLYARHPDSVPTTYRLSATREVLYGPLTLLSTGIFAPDEPLADFVLDDWEDNLTMSSTLGIPVHGWVDDELWFSRGGMVFQSNLQNPISAYLRRGEIPAALRTFYNGFAACHYPDANVMTEEYRTWTHPSGPFYKIPDEARVVHRLRDLLVREEGDALWLLGGAPRRWLAPGQTITLADAPTHFGPVRLRAHAGTDQIRVELTLPGRAPAREAYLALRAPEGKRLATVSLDGAPWTDFDPARERIRLPRRTGPMTIVAVLADAR